MQTNTTIDCHGRRNHRHRTRSPPVPTQVVVPNNHSSDDDYRVVEEKLHSEEHPYQEKRLLLFQQQDDYYRYCRVRHEDERCISSRLLRRDRTVYDPSSCNKKEQKVVGSSASPCTASRSQDVSPSLPKRLVDDAATPVTVPSLTMAQSPTTVAATCLLSSLPPMPQRKSSIEPPASSASASVSASTGGIDRKNERVTGPSSLLDVEEVDDEDNHLEDQGRKSVDHDESPKTLPTIPKIRNTKASKLTMSGRVGNLKRAGTSYRLNQRLSEEYHQHGRRRSEPVGCGQRGSSSNRHCSDGNDESIEDNCYVLRSEALLNAMAIAAASVNMEEDDDEEEMETETHKHDRILRTRSLGFASSNM